MINKYQAGGAAQLGSILQEIAKLPQEQQKKIMTAFGKWAQAKGLNIQQLQGNEQALEQAMGQFLQEMQSQLAPKARLGAKLNYIRTLKGNAPEGMIVEYYKCGGQTKKRFVKAAGGEKVKDGKKEIEEFKKKKACKGSSLKFELGGEAPKKKESEKPQQRLDPKTTKKLPGGKYPSYWTSKERQTWERLHGDNDEGAGTVENKGVGKNCNGGKARKHFYGGSLNRIPFYLGGTPKGGITEKSDNTRVSRIPNNGEAVYEKTPQGIGDFLPLVGTYRAAQRIDRGEPGASYSDLAINGAMDALGVGMVGSVAKAAGRVGKLHKALKARGYSAFTKDGSQWYKLPKYIMSGLGDKLYTWRIPDLYGAPFKTVPTVNYAPAAMAPMVLTLRVPATAPFKK